MYVWMTLMFLLTCTFVTVLRKLRSGLSLVLSYNKSSLPLKAELGLNKEKYEVTCVTSFKWEQPYSKERFVHTSSWFLNLYGKWLLRYGIWRVTWQAATRHGSTSRRSRGDVGTPKILNHYNVLNSNIKMDQHLWDNDRFSSLQIAVEGQNEAF